MKTLVFPKSNQILVTRYMYKNDFGTLVESSTEVKLKRDRFKNMGNDRWFFIDNDTNIESWYYREFGTLGTTISFGGVNRKEIENLFVEKKLKTLSLELLSQQYEAKAKVYSRGIYIDRKQKTIVRFVNHDNLEPYVYVYAVTKDETILNDLVKELSSHFYKHKYECKAHLLMRSNGGLYLHEGELPKVKIDLRLNYGDEFANKHKRIVKSLETEPNGLYIFSGAPGTGKTTYIKYLTSVVDKKFIFVPSGLMASLGDPDLLKVLFENPNCVLILEDAERAILKREGSTGDSIVSTILNMSDGILGGILNTSIIVTFNTAKDIDEAILRKGRLIHSHEFGNLSQKEAQSLLDKMFKGKNYIAEKDMSLADIYNFEKNNDFKDEKQVKILGFAAK